MKIRLGETHRKQAILPFCSDFPRRFVNIVSKVRNSFQRILQDQTGPIVVGRLEAHLGYKVREGLAVNMAIDL